MDVAYVMDVTGSMGGAISSVQEEAARQVKLIRNFAGGDYQLALVTFNDTVIVNDDLALRNGTAVVDDVLSLAANGGSNEPEASDEALNTVINGLDEDDRLPGQQTGDFNGFFRPEATKILFLITDARPGGFNDTFTPGVDDANAHLRALEAQADGIQIGAIYVPTQNTYESTIIPIMKDYAITSNGLYLRARSDGSNTALAIEKILSKICGA
jgi:hypothetical protein